MAAANVCGICQVVVSRREELVAVRPAEKLLVLETLKYAVELRQPDDFARDLASVKETKQEWELTSQLIKALTVKTFDLAEYRDLYEERLRELIDAKIDGREIAAAPEHKAPAVINLMDAIRKSMKQIKTQSAEKRPRRSAAHATSARRRKSG